MLLLPIVIESDGDVSGGRDESGVMMPLGWRDQVGGSKSDGGVDAVE